MNTNIAGTEEGTHANRIHISSRNGGAAGCLAAAMLVLMAAPLGAQPIATRTAEVGRVKLQYLTAGRGPAVLLLHGYAETSRMWRPLIPEAGG